MSEHPFDDRDMPGYFLPEDSQLLLKQLKSHINFLARLAQPRIADETREVAPEVGMGELMFCLDQLAEQLDSVLQEVSWPALRTSSEALEASEDAVDDAQEPDNGYAPIGEGRFIFALTIEQFDKLNLLMEGITAYGDAVSADDMADFARGTLSLLGHTIFDRARDVNEILRQVQAQKMENGTRPRFHVKETPPAYCVQPASNKGCDVRQVLALDYQSQSPGSSPGGLHLH